MKARGTRAMATLAAPVEQKVILHGVSWETYERLLNEHQESPGTHFIYDEGELEIMVLSRRHEEPNTDLALLVQLIAMDLGINFRQLGSTTFKRKRLRKGFEPDSAFYFASAAEMEGLDLDPEIDPPPDLIIEIDVTSPSLDRFPIFAAFGAPEVWRYHGSRVTFHRLEIGQYVETPRSSALPPLTSQRPDASDECNRIVRKLLVKDRGARYQTAVAVRDDLRDVVSSSQPPSTASARIPAASSTIASI
jgi:Uma2 family endonuclease